MRIKWTDKFLNIARSNGLVCQVLHREHGWLETLIIDGQLCYAKSKTYDPNKREYYIGVDPKKLNDTGDIVLICGGNQDGQIRDIFISPWLSFFHTLRAGDPKNTYCLPKKYLQYRFYLRDSNDSWKMSVQPAGRHELDVTHWRHSVDEALNVLKSKNAL